MKNLIESTTNTIDGHRIVSYLGVYTSEVVVGTGPVSEFFGRVADLFGVRSSSFESKLDKGRTQAFNVLQTKGEKIGANAMIGLDIDIMAYEKNRTGMIVTATMVKVVPEEKNVVMNRILECLEEMNDKLTNVNRPGIDEETSKPVQEPSMIEDKPNIFAQTNSEGRIDYSQLEIDGLGESSRDKNNKEEKSKDNEQVKYANDLEKQRLMATGFLPPKKRPCDEANPS